VKCCRAELEIGKECYDVIIGDLADPIEGGPCYKLYTKSFYEHTVKPRLNQGGIFITQVYNRFWFLERERQRGRGRMEEIIIHVL
jgi:spermidine synthase